MKQEQVNTALQKINEGIEAIENKTFNVYFFVIDTKGTPSGYIEYIYQTALVLKNRGYNVTMLHNEKDFIGVGDWFDGEYESLPHKNVETDTVELGIYDFLFIPEVAHNVMRQTKNVPCKRIIIMENYNYLCEFFPVGTTPESVGIHEVITTTKTQEELLNSLFPETKTYVVSPAILNKFRSSEEPKKLIINVVAKDSSDVNKIVKPFYWRYPIYNWVSFRDLRDMNQDVFSDALREAAFTIWVDTPTNFGYSAIEALKCGSIVIGKVPERLTDWNIEDGELTDKIIWFDDFDNLSKLIANMVRTWTLDKLPDYLFDTTRVEGMYTKENQEKEIENVYIESIFNTRLKEFAEVKTQLENNSLNIEK